LTELAAALADAACGCLDCCCDDACCCEAVKSYFLIIFLFIFPVYSKKYLNFSFLIIILILQFSEITGERPRLNKLKHFDRPPSVIRIFDKIKFLAN
jgi:hypothetical protein